MGTSAGKPALYNMFPVGGEVPITRWASRDDGRRLGLADERLYGDAFSWMGVRKAGVVVPAFQHQLGGFLKPRDWGSRDYHPDQAKGMPADDDRGDEQRRMEVHAVADSHRLDHDVVEQLDSKIEPQDLSERGEALELDGGDQHANSPPEDGAEKRHHIGQARKRAEQQRIVDAEHPQA